MHHAEAIHEQPSPGRRRIEGLDAARALAIVGMVMVHFGPTRGEPIGWAEWAYRLSHGRAALLFVVLAGIGVTLLLGDRDRERWRRGWPRLVGRVIVLLPLGLALQRLDVAVLVILQYYALFFVLAAGAVWLRDAVVLALAACFALIGPVSYRIVEVARPLWIDRANPATLGDPPLELARDLVLTGSYPVIVWIAPMLFGVWLGRRQLQCTRTRVMLLVGGAVATGAALALDAMLPDDGWWLLASTEPHSQMIGWLIGSSGAAAAGLAVCLMLSDALGRGRWPAVAMGQMALTVYVAHLLLLAAAPGVFVQPHVGPAVAVVVMFALVAAGAAVMWRQFLSRGPLEAAMHAVGGGIARARDGLRR